VTFRIEHKTDRGSVASDMGGCMGLAGDTGLGMGRTNLWLTRGVTCSPPRCCCAEAPQRLAAYWRRTWLSGSVCAN